MKIILFFSLLLGLTACDVQKPSRSPDATGILGGDPVAHESPIAKHVAALVASDGRSQYLCTVVLIAKNTVLTAAHCGLNLKDAELVFASEAANPSERVHRPVISAETNPRFDDTVKQFAGDEPLSPASIKNWGDLAVLKFSGSTPRGFRPVQIADGSQLHNGQSVILAGYGLADGDDPSSAGELNSVEVTIKNANFTPSEFTVDQNSGQQGACHGDSGGPAFVMDDNKLYLAGITSRGFDEDCKTASIFSRVSYFLDWIQKAAE